MQSTYDGDVKTIQDAIQLFEACRLGLLPRVLRRLSKNEMESIKSGSVFVWMEHEAGMKRWTDRRLWSASRVAGNFLTYTEMEGKKGRRGGKTQDKEYKQNGLEKKSLSLTTSDGQRLHIISYYSRSHQNLLQPTTNPTLRHIVPDMKIYLGLEAEGPHATKPCNKSDVSRESSTNKGGLSGLSFPHPVSAYNQPYQQYHGMPQHPQQTAFDQRLSHVFLPPPTQQANYALAEAALYAAPKITIGEGKQIMGVFDRNLRI